MIADPLLKALPEEISWRIRLVWHSMRVPLPARFIVSLVLSAAITACSFRKVSRFARARNARDADPLERHRLIFLWLAENAYAVANKRVVHFAPEPAIRKLLQPHASHYIAGDLVPRAGDRVLDIDAIALPDGSADFVFCSHVLEHVDDRKALGEMHRILSSDGLAIILVPLIEGWKQTYKNDAIATPEGRNLHCGQHDHVRYFGADIRERIKRAEFDLSEFPAVEPEVHTYSLLRGETIFVARK
jgi:SAM-dependent methyltransferase